MELCYLCFSKKQKEKNHLQNVTRKLWNNVWKIWQGGSAAEALFAQKKKKAILGKIRKRQNNLWGRVFFSKEQHGSVIKMLNPVV